MDWNSISSVNGNFWRSPGCPASSLVSLQKENHGGVREARWWGASLVVKVARDSHLENHLHMNLMNSIRYDLCTLHMNLMNSIRYDLCTLHMNHMNSIQYDLCTCIWIIWIIWIVVCSMIYTCIWIIYTIIYAYDNCPCVRSYSDSISTVHT